MRERERTNERARDEMVSVSLARSALSLLLVLTELGRGFERQS